MKCLLRNVEAGTQLRRVDRRHRQTVHDGASVFIRQRVERPIQER